MSERSETPANSQQANSPAPMTRREALARERAAGGSLEPEVTLPSSVPEITPLPQPRILQAQPAVAPIAPAVPLVQPTVVQPTVVQPLVSATEPVQPAKAAPRAERHTHAAATKPAKSRGLGTRLWSPNRQSESTRPTTPPSATKASTAPRKALHWVRGGAGLALVAGLFATVALPAYSLSSEGQTFSTSDMFASSRQQAQSMNVDGTAIAQAATTDGYSSQTKAQLTASQIQAIRTTMSNYGPARQADGDDYPFWNMATEYAGGGLSPLGYYYRECVDFVAWRLNRDAGSTSAPWRWVWANLASGSAYAWYSAWRSHGWETSSSPIAGAVAWFPYNHVAYVKSVNSDGTVNIEEYNQQSDHLYHNRTIAASDAIYLYPPS